MRQIKNFILPKKRKNEVQVKRVYIDEVECKSDLRYELAIVSLETNRLNVSQNNPNLKKILKS
jgi:hypothetical protein